MPIDPGALCDTNILTALLNDQHPRHDDVAGFVERRRAVSRLVVAPQSLYEYWAVATRPRDVNGMARTPEQAATDVVALRQAFTVLPDPPGLLDEWLDLCRAHGVSGKPAHDARLAAYARLHGIGTLVTLNARDFARYGLGVVVP